MVSVARFLLLNLYWILYLKEVVTQYRRYHVFLTIKCTLFELIESWPRKPWVKIEEASGKSVFLKRLKGLGMILINTRFSIELRVSRFLFLCFWGKKQKEHYSLKQAQRGVSWYGSNNFAWSGCTQDLNLLMLPCLEAWVVYHCTKWWPL